MLLVAAMAMPWAMRAQECTQAIPYTEGFETVDGTTYSASGVLPDCWEGYTDGTNLNYTPHVVTGSGLYSYRHSGENSLAMTSGTASYGRTKYVLLPPMAMALNQLYLSFWMYSEAADHGVLTVGYVTGDDTSTFTPVASYPASSDNEHNGNGLQPDLAGYEVELSLAGLPDSATRLAFRWVYESSYYTCCIDDVTVGYPPTCPRVTDLTASATETSVTVTWTETGDANLWEVTVSQYGEPVASGLYNTLPATVTGLTPNTDYTVAVRAVCGSGDTSLARIRTFRTPCATVTADELPWTYGFEDASGSGAFNTFSPCLGRHATNTTTAYPYPYSYQAHDTGVYSLYMYSNNSNGINSWLTLPLFEASLNTLQLSFWVYRSYTNNSYGHWAVGVMSDPDDLTTFDTIATGQATEGWELVEVPLVGYNGTGTWLAILCPTTTSYCYTYIDDLTVDYLPACIPALGVTASGITPTSVTLTVNDPVATGNYRLVVSSGEWVAIDTVVSSSNAQYSTYTLTGLEPTATYEATVSRQCDSEAESHAVRTVFTTPCAAVTEYPWMEDFNGTGNINDLTCWERYTGLYNDTAAFGLTPATSGWTLYSNHGMEGSPHVKLNIYGASIHHWLISPLFAVESDMRLEFDYSLTAYNSDAPNNALEEEDDRFIVFVVTEEGDFVPLATWGGDSVRDDYNYRDIQSPSSSVNLPLDAYAGETVRFAFYGESTMASGDNDLHIDNLYVGGAAACPKPSTAWVSGITASEATVQWTDPAATGSYVVVYHPVDMPDSPDTVYVYNATDVTLTALADNTNYVVNVMANCGALTAPRQTLFRTPCTPIGVLPWFEDFETAATGSSSELPSCMTRLNNGSNHYPYTDSYAADNHTPDGAQGLYWVNSTTVTAGDYRCVVLPAVDTALYPVNTLQVQFWARSYYSSKTPLFQVGVMTDPYDIGTFEPVQEVTVRGTVFARYTAALTHYSGAGQYVAILSLRDAVSWSASVDDITLEVRPSCPDVVDLEATATAGGVLLGWELPEGYDAPTGYRMVVKEAESVVVDTTTYNAPLPTASITGLEPGTPYKAYVQAVCGEDDMGRPDSVEFTTQHLGCALYDAATTDIVTLTGGSDEALTDNHIPVANYWKYSYTQQLVRANEMHGSATLNAIAFEYAYSTPSTAKNDVTLYLANVSDTTLEESFVDYSDSLFVPVYHGPLNCTQGWNQFAFDVPFAYDSNSNLLIVVHDNSGDYDGNAYKFATHEAFGLARYVQNDNNTYVLGSIGSNGSLTHRANMKLYSGDCLVAATCAAPAAMVVGTTTASATLAWTPGAGETAWDIAYRPLGMESWTTAATGVTATSYTVGGLMDNTTYDFRVSFVCSDTVGGTYEVLATGTTLPLATDTTPTADTHAVVHATYDVTLNEGESFRGYSQAGCYREEIAGETVDSVIVTRVSMVINHTVGQGTAVLASNVDDGAWMGLDDLYSHPQPNGTVNMEPMTTRRYLFTHTETSGTMVDNGDFERGYWDGEELSPDYTYVEANYIADITTDSYGYLNGYGKNNSHAMVVNGFNDSSKTLYSVGLNTQYGHTYRLSYSSRNTCITCGIPTLVMYVDGEPKTTGDMVYSWQTYTHTFVAGGDYTVVSLRWGGAGGTSGYSLPMVIALDDISVVDLMSAEPSYDTITVTNRHQLVYDTTQVHICAGNTYATDGQLFGETGVYALTPQPTADTTYLPALALTVHDNYHTQREAKICDGDSVAAAGDIARYYSKTGTYVDSLLSFAGCDSIVTLTLTVKPAYHHTDTLFACDNQLPYLYHEMPLDSAGTYDVTLQSVEGCDSTLAVTLTVGATRQTTEEITLCQSGMPYLYGDHTFDTATVSGLYNVVFGTAEGCDSVVVLDLTVHESEVPEIYVVTVQNTHNLVMWDKHAAIDHYNIYRESSTSGLYSIVAEIPYSETSVWLDEGSDARSRSYRYRMTAVDSCGVESDYGTTHKTMHLTINQGQGNAWNLVWTEYEGASYSTYRIYRGTSYYNLQLIDEMPAGGNTTYTDNSAPYGYVYYQIVVLLTPGAKGTKDDADGTIRSNIATNDQTGIPGSADVPVRFTVESGERCIVVEAPVGVQLQVFDVTGRRMYDAVSTGKDLIEVPATGVYLVQAAGMKAKRIVVQGK